jgi:hypothetical protein
MISLIDDGLGYVIFLSWTVLWQSAQLLRPSKRSDAVQIATSEGFH